MQPVKLLLSEITINPVTVESHIGKKIHTGNIFEYKALRILKPSNLEIKVTVTIEDPDRRITNPLQFIESTKLIFKEPQVSGVMTTGTIK